MNIREFIYAYLKDRDMTLMDLTAKLGYRSKTSVVRIMKGDISARSLETFMTRLRKAGGLSEAENARLNEAVEVLRWQEDYYPSREMLGLLQGSMRDTGEVKLDCVNPKEDGSFTQDVPVTFEEAFEGATNIDIMLINCQYVPIFERIYDLIIHQDAMVSHYLMVNDDTTRTIHAMNVISPIMFMSNYSGYLFKQTDENGHNGIQSADFMLVNWVSAKGVRRESLILFDTPNHGRVYRSGYPGALAKLLAIPRESYQPIKRSFMNVIEMESYVQFCRECADAERNRRLYAIKPDICMQYVPVDILLAAAKEGRVGQTEGFIRNEGRLVDIFETRFKNVFERRKAHHTIMKRSAIWRFARTGRMSDHFWGLRPFTLQERAAIIRHLIDQEENNPFFHIYFLKDNQFLRDMEVICYDGVGLLMVNANTDYDFAEGHAEVMLDHPEFQRLYKDFYLKHLIREHVISPADAREFLRGLVEYCEDPNTEESVDC